MSAHVFSVVLCLRLFTHRELVLSVLDFTSNKEVMVAAERGEALVFSLALQIPLVILFNVVS